MIVPERSTNQLTIKDIIKDIQKTTNITPNKINYEHIESVLQQLEACMSTDEEDDFMLSFCEFIEEVPYNPLLLMPYHNQQLLKLEKLIGDKIYQYKSELLSKQKMINIDMANNFVITIFKIFYAFKNKEISYSIAAILVNQYISDKIQQIEIIEHIEKIPSRECNIYIAPPIQGCPGPSSWVVQVWRESYCLGIIRNAILFSLHYTIGLYSIVNNHLFASFDFKPLNC